MQTTYLYGTRTKFGLKKKTENPPVTSTTTNMLSETFTGRLEN